MLPLWTIAQPSLNEIRRDYSSIFYELKGNSASISILDEYVNTYFAFGDKLVINSMIIENLVGENSEIYDSHLDEVVLSSADSLLLNTGISLSQDLREVPYHSFIYLIYAGAYRDSMEIIKSLYAVMLHKEKLFPHLPGSQMRTTNKFVNELMLTAEFLNWALAYPREFQNLSKHLRDFLPEVITSATEDIDLFKSMICEHFKTSFYTHFVPVGIDNCQTELDISANNVLSDQLMRERPVDFLNLVFEAILSRAPTNDEENKMVDYINNNNDLTAKSVYYTLILKKQLQDE